MVGIQLKLSPQHSPYLPNGFLLYIYQKWFVSQIQIFSMNMNSITCGELGHIIVKIIICVCAHSLTNTAFTPFRYINIWIYLIIVLALEKGFARPKTVFVGAMSLRVYANYKGVLPPSKPFTFLSDGRSRFLGVRRWFTTKGPSERDSPLCGFPLWHYTHDMHQFAVRFPAVHQFRGSNEDISNRRVLCQFFGHK